MICRPNKVAIIVKWSKTMKSNKQVQLTTIPAICRSPSCPVSKLQLWLVHNMSVVLDVKLNVLSAMLL